MPNPNISAEIAPADKTTMKANVDANMDIINPFAVNLTPKERKKLYKLGPGSVGFTQTCLDAALNYPGIIPSDFSILELRKDVNLFTDLEDVSSHHARYFEALDDTRLAVGSEAMKQALRVYELFKSSAKNDASLNTIVAQMARRFEGQGKKKKPPTP